MVSQVDPPVTVSGFTYGNRTIYYYDPNTFDLLDMTVDPASDPNDSSYVHSGVAALL